MKILVDEYPGLQIITTGSSSFDLSNKINEPLTGRKIEIKLFPFSLEEISKGQNELEQKRTLENFLIFGSYPENYLGNKEESIKFLKELANSYLFKDILDIVNLRKSETLIKLLRLLAFQIGSLVSFHELARQIGIDQKIVQKYLYLLEEAFIIYRLPSFGRNLRKEINKKRKIYFWDLGIRNTLINNYNNLELRNDIGALWENFLVLERTKFLEYNQKYANQYFWRTHDGKEIDYLEEFDGLLHGYEFKWKKNQFKVPKEFLETYSGSSIKLINKENFLEFLT